MLRLRGEKTVDKGSALHDHIHGFAFGVEVDKFDMRSG
jgi:hypothetical protein